MVIGGFPCQSFSTVNPTKDTNDDRAQLYKQIVRMLNVKKPKVFICENVKGLMLLRHGEIIKRIVSEFEEEGYVVKFQILKAVEYGVPQRRERVIIVGIRKDINYSYSFPKPLLKESEYVPLKKVINKLAIEDTKYYFSQKAVLGMKKAKKNMKRGLWQDLNGPCLTITSHLAKTSINSRDPILLVDPQNEVYRRFTPREAARIQSFPDSFTFPISDSFAYKQIGNAVPPVLMWYVANSVLGAFGFQQEDAKTSLNRPIVRQLDFITTLERYPDNIVVNTPESPKEDLAGNPAYDKTKSVLISYVKSDNMDQYLDRSAKVYYTGKRFPATVALNKLYYFMPYFKGKGIRDLYLIKIARVGTRKEGQPDNDPHDFRLVFEIQYLCELFDDYQPINLEIWRTFTDTNMTELFLKLKQSKLSLSHKA